MQSIGFFCRLKSLDAALSSDGDLLEGLRIVLASCPLSDEIANAPAYQQDQKDIK
jgi:hypothetical protein